MTQTGEQRTGPRVLALLGGTGGTGRLLIDEALESGYQLRVLARDPAKVHRQDPRLTVVQGDARDPEAVTRLLDGADAVLSALGPARGEAAGVLTRAADNLVSAMPTAGIRRLIVLTGAGVRDPGDRPKLVDRVFRTLLERLQPALLRDSEEYVQRVRGSGLDWTVVRAPMLTDGPARAVRVGLVGDIGPRVSRASVARFMLEQLGSDRYSRQAPALSH